MFTANLLKLSTDKISIDLFQRTLANNQIWNIFTAFHTQTVKLIEKGRTDDFISQTLKIFIISTFKTNFIHQKAIHIKLASKQ